MTAIVIAVGAVTASAAEGFHIYVSPSEHDDRLHAGISDTGVWDSLEEAADYLHSHVFPSLEADGARTYVIDTVYSLEYALNKYPADTGRVRSLLKKGQLAVSGNYIAYSSNHHEQETVVRFVTYAKWYLRNHFGYDAKFIKRPDSPGFTPQTGQIYSKAGVDLFVNNRLTYLTSSHYWDWVGLDGTKTLTLHPHYDYGIHATSIYDPNKKGLDSFPRYTPAASRYGHRLFDRLSAKNWPGNIAWVMAGSDNSMPNIPNVQAFVNGWNAEPGQDKPMKMSNLTDFLSEVRSHVSSGKIRPEKCARWGIGWGIRQDDDTFPPFMHLNDARRRMLDLEKVASLCEILGLSSYPTSEIQEDWGKILFGRDHSNLGYIRVIDSTNRRSLSDVARVAEDRIRRLLHDRLTKLANAVDYARPGTPVLVFNTLNWSRTEPVELQLTLRSRTYKAVDPTGSEVPLQAISSTDLPDGNTLHRFLLMATDVPSLGYKVFYVVPGKSSVHTDVSAVAGRIENRFYRVVVDSAGFRSICDKELGRELVARNRISTYQKTQTGETVNFGEVVSSKFFDGPVHHFRPFNYLKKGSLISRMVVDNFRVVETGPFRATIRINAHLETERIVITTSLYQGSKRIGLKYELVRSGAMLDGNQDGEPDYVTIPLPLNMSDDMKQQFGVVYGSMDNPVLADVAEGTGGGSPIGVQWPTQPAAPGKIISGGFSSHQQAQNVRGHIGYRWNRHTDRKQIHQWTDVREPDDSFGVTIAHPGVIQYERLNFVAPVLCAWEPGLRAWGVNYENGVPFPEPGDRKIFMKSVPGENYTASLFLRSHQGSWDTSQAYKLGSETNYPLLVGYPDTRSGSQLDESASFLGLTPDSAPRQIPGRFTTRHTRTRILCGTPSDRSCLNRVVFVRPSSGKEPMQGDLDMCNVGPVKSKLFVLLLVVSTLMCTADAEAETIRAASCSQQDVQKAVDAASDGDTVVVPAGAATWTTSDRNLPAVLVSRKGSEKEITLHGAGIDQTIITDSTGSQCFQVAIKSSESRIYSAVKQKPLRITGFTFKGNGGNAVILLDAPEKWRIDNCRFEDSGRSLIVGGFGVIDHCVFDKKENGQCIFVSHSGFAGGSYGDGSWSSPLTLGTQNAVYIEDCTFNYYSQSPNAALDACQGARLVFRHNTLINAWLGNHGTESSGRGRSVRSYEIYNNTFKMEIKKWHFTAMFLRGGTGVIFGNIVTGGYTNVILANNYRSTRAYAPWGKCDGSSRWDGNQEPNGYPAIDQIGRSTDSGPGTRQELDPLYEWRNTLNGEDADIAVADNPAVRRHIKAGRDFHNDTEKSGYTAFVYPHPLVQKNGASPRTGPNK